MVYTGTAALAKEIYNALRTALDGASVPVDVLLVHGSQSALEKFLYTRAFTSTSTDMADNGINLRGFVGTSGIDAGLDHPNLAKEVILQIYDRRAGTIKRYNVEGLLFQLFSLGILHLSHVSKSGSGMIVLTREKASINRRDVYSAVATLDESSTRKYDYDTVLRSPLLN